MRRPGPLQEFPLDLFLPPNPNLPTKSRPNKRPLSPGGPSLFSPAKRRILNGEGIFSPEKTLKSPISSRYAAARFADVLSGPASPAKKLDFGVAKHRVESPRSSRLSSTIASTTPTRTISSSSRLAPSPELAPSPHQDCEDDREGYFSYTGYSSCTFIERELPPPPDPQSSHYPGFRVYYDTHIPLTSVDMDMDDVAPADKDKGGQKENVAPRRKPRKVITAPNPDFKFQLFSPEDRKRELDSVDKATPATPKKDPSRDRQNSSDSPTPRRPIVGLTQAATGATPRLTSKGKEEMRRVLQDEADQRGNDDDDLML
ncbi:hypothetical protein BDZ94DRAFT_485135 [Collybia nuda]|uniref:Uncharacterized protein n=1 Tax=Collybia nuda TaxID=64659 RepID=A0A9P6CKY9_9AGAR|nr:hypothetical protein BDZ94DRAFT_485135 [Collybia nuda]